MREKEFGFKETDFLVLTRLFRDDLDSTADLERFSEKCFPVISLEKHHKAIDNAIEKEWETNGKKWFIAWEKTNEDYRILKQQISEKELINKEVCNKWLKEKPWKKAYFEAWKRAEYNLRLREKQVAKLEKTLLKKDMEIKRFLRFLRNTNWFSEPQIQQLSYVIKRVGWDE
jgi:hypothetical protein